MDAQHWQQADRIFQAALERAPGERAVFLDEACSGDPNLRRKVEALLSSDEQGWDLLERPAFEGAVGLLAEDQPNLFEGEQIGHYKVLGLLGTGGMGEVYLAEDSSLGRKIALKVLPATFVKHKNRIARFQQEARAASALNHPNIVTIHEISQFEGRHFIAIEFIEGETLRQRIKRGKLDVGEALDIAIQVAGALAAAHRAGIVHRDIKPENIMLRTDGYVKILDFGLAKLTEQPETVREIEEQSDGQSSISSGLLMGTVRYMSPEQASGLKVDARSDIFSFGVVLYEMVTGHRPFEGETNQELLEEILKKQPPMDFAEDASGEQKQILLRTLSKDRSERYQTVDDLLADLKQLKRGLELGVGAYNLPRSTAGHPPIGGADPMLPLAISGVRALMSSIKRRKLTAFTAALLLVGATAILYGLYHFAGRDKAAARFQIQELKQLTTSGKARDAAISPDGKYVAYVSEDERGQSIWLRQVDTTTTTELVSGSRERLAALTFSPDGDRIFFVRYDDEEQARNALCEISVLGGPTQRLISEVHSPISFSPDGKRFAFFRRYEIQTENALMLANIDGTGEQELGRRRRPERFSDYPCGPAWSPDGTLIAYGVRVGTRTVINVMEPDNRAEKTIAGEDRGGISSLAWLPDVSGIIITAPERVGSARGQLWMVSYPSGESRRITNDLVFYLRASVATKSGAIVIEQILPVGLNSNLWLVQDGDASQAKQITTDAGRYKPSWTPDGKIIYSLSAAGSGTHIYGIEADGSQKRRLTSGPASYFGANVSPDGRYIAFISTDREEGEGIYIMDMDGSNLRRLVGAQLLGGFEFSWSPDSKWVVYRAGTGPGNSSPEAIWKVSIEGGDPIQLTDFSFIRSPTVSPDGKLIACFYGSSKENPQSGFALIPFEGGAPVKRFAMNAGRVSGWCQWTRDGRALMYVDTQAGVSNIWSQPIDGGPPRKLTEFISDQIGYFQWSPDGKQLACSRGSDKRDVILLRYR